VPAAIFLKRLGISCVVLHHLEALERGESQEKRQKGEVHPLLVLLAERSGIGLHRR
jgi:hypothetical protein